MENNEIPAGEIPDTVLLEDGLYKLDRALESLMEMKSETGKALAGIVHGALVFGEAMMNAGDCDG